MAKNNRGGKVGTAQSVPIDKWGREINNEPIKRTLPDGTTEVYGYTNDENVYEYEPFVQSITKKEILSEIDALKNDDGTYGDDDYGIFVSYENGETWDNSSGQKLKKKGIIGVSVNTPDEQMVWGEDWIGSGRNRRRVPMESVETDEVPAKTNSRIGYRAVSVYKQRVRTTYDNIDPRTGGYKPKREIIRKSSVKKL